MKSEDGIWIFSEVGELALEILGKARELAEKIGTEVTAISTDATLKAEDYVRFGADTVLSITNQILDRFHVETYVDALTSVAYEREPELILIGATRNGLELASRLAERLKTGCVTEAIRLEPDAEKQFILMDRLSMGGTTVETQASKTKPQIATVREGAFSSIPADASRKGKILRINLAHINSPTVRVLETKPKISGNAGTLRPDVVVCLGGSVKRKADISLVEEFAKTLGAEFTFTRSIAEQWFPNERYVGFGGRIVRPKLCLTCGMSGHFGDIAGILSSQVVLSINRDPLAHIFEFSDYAVIADAHELLPKLTEAIKHLSKS